MILIQVNTIKSQDQFKSYDPHSNQQVSQLVSKFKKQVATRTSADTHCLQLNGVTRIPSLEKWLLDEAEEDVKKAMEEAFLPTNNQIIP